MTRYRWTLLGLLFGFWGLVGINRLGIQFLFPFINADFHLNLAQDSLLISGTSLTWAFSSWASGWLSDRYGRRSILLPGAALACLTTMAQGAAWNFLSLFLIRDLVGIGDGVGWPNGQSVLAEEVPAKRRALVAGVFTSGYPFFGGVIGGLIMAPLALYLGWHWVFPLLGAVFLLVVIALWFVMREPSRERRVERLDWRNLFSAARNRRVLVLMLIQTGALGWLQVGVLLNVNFLVMIVHTSSVTAGQIVAGATIGGIAGTLLLPALSDYIGRRPAILLGGLLSALLLGLYVFGGFPLSVAVPLLIGNAFFQAVLIPLGSATCVVELVGEEHRATAMGSVNFVGVILGTFLIPIAAGLVGTAFGLRAAYLVAVTCVGLAGLLVLLIPETAPRVVGRRSGAVVTA